MGQFDRQIATVKRLVLKNGELVTWRIPTAEPPDPSPSDTPWKPVADDATDYDNVPVCFLPVGTINNELMHLLKGTEVTTGSVKGLMGAVSFVPAANAVVVRSNGETLRIKSIDTLSPNGQIILYTIVFDQ